MASEPLLLAICVTEGLGVGGRGGGSGTQRGGGGWQSWWQRWQPSTHNSDDGGLGWQGNPSARDLHQEKRILLNCT
jgi:hypothetical protein